MNSQDQEKPCPGKKTKMTHTQTAGDEKLETLLANLSADATFEVLISTF